MSRVTYCDECIQGGQSRSSYYQDTPLPRHVMPCRHFRALDKKMRVLDVFLKHYDRDEDYTCSAIRRPLEKGLFGDRKSLVIQQHLHDYTTAKHEGYRRLSKTIIAEIGEHFKDLRIIMRDYERREHEIRAQRIRLNGESPQSCATP